jgi:hypothetical protein
MNWEPWEVYKQQLEVLQIFAPPCSECNFFRPMRKYRGIYYNGVVICHSEDMEHDFSCFRNREK